MFTYVTFRLVRPSKRYQTRGYGQNLFSIKNCDQKFLSPYEGLRVNKCSTFHMRKYIYVYTGIYDIRWEVESCLLIFINTFLIMLRSKGLVSTFVTRALLIEIKLK